MGALEKVLVSYCGFGSALHCPLTNQVRLFTA
jgi:hypothetical protein